MYFSHSCTVYTDDDDDDVGLWAQSSTSMPKQLYPLHLVLAGVGVCSHAFSMLQLESLSVLVDLSRFTVLLGAQGFRYAAA